VTGTPGLPTAGARLRTARLDRRLSQQELADVAGVTRQAVAGIEAGRWDPSLRVALALSRALGRDVEDLFGSLGPLPVVRAERLGPLGDPGSRVDLALVGETWVAMPLTGADASPAGFRPASGLVGVEPGQVRLLTLPRTTLVVAGCDPALSLLEDALGRLEPPVGLAWWPCGSERSLELATAGLVHAAGVHVRDPATGSYNRTALARVPAGATLVGFAAWREGLVLRPELSEVHSLADLAARGLRIVNREPGAEARAVLERACQHAGIRPQGLPGYETESRGHLALAAAVAARLAAAGVASEPAAIAHGLPFLPLTSERFDLLIPQGHADAPAVQGLLRVLRSSGFRAQLAALPGYDAEGCGELFGAG
jgi:molybdate-binding protein/DNA-binding XRE family transcriptional regulator